MIFAGPARWRVGLPGGVRACRFEPGTRFGSAPPTTCPDPHSDRASVIILPLQKRPRPGRNRGCHPLDDIRIAAGRVVARAKFSQRAQARGIWADTGSLAESSTLKPGPHMNEFWEITDEDISIVVASHKGSATTEKARAVLDEVRIIESLRQFGDFADQVASASSDIEDQLMASGIIPSASKKFASPSVSIPR